MKAVFGHSFYVKTCRQRLVRWSLTTTTVAIAGYWLSNALTGQFLNHGRPILIAAIIGFLSCLWLTLALLCALRVPIGISSGGFRRERATQRRLPRQRQRAVPVDSRRSDALTPTLVPASIVAHQQVPRSDLWPGGISKLEGVVLLCWFLSTRGPGRSGLDRWAGYPPIAIIVSSTIY